jgi:hypothetical protein
MVSTLMVLFSQGALGYSGRGDSKDEDRGQALSCEAGSRFTQRLNCRFEFPDSRYILVEYTCLLCPHVKS